MGRRYVVCFEGGIGVEKEVRAEGFGGRQGFEYV
jgi:hypothetical protein